MKAKKFKATPVPDLVGKGPTDTITRGEAVALLAARVPPGPFDDEKTMRNKMSARLNDAVSRTKILCPIAPRKFLLGDLARWAIGKWPGHFDDLPVSRRTFKLTLKAQTRAVGRMRPGVYPATLDASHKVITSLEAHIAEAEKERNAAQKQVRALSIGAQKWENLIAKKRKKKQ
ncbi:MAG: hypothetical protein IT521_06140 [Burkholderiales bacterium]|nr:hypothetical protein [Burkholderiales bacterium]